jgi:hypothetical protein
LEGDKMTWKEFKDKLVEQGVRDNMEINYIDITNTSPAGLEVVVTPIDCTKSEFCVYN